MELIAGFGEQDIAGYHVHKKIEKIVKKSNQIKGLQFIRHSYMAKIAGLAVRMNFPMRHLRSLSTMTVLSLMTSPYAL